MVNAYVITGGPHCGKTTVVKELAKKGYNTVPEAARDIIAAQQIKKDGIVPWTYLPEFQTLVLTEQLRREVRYEGQDYFAERGIFDGEGY